MYVMQVFLITQTVESDLNCWVINLGNAEDKFDMTISQDSKGCFDRLRSNLIPSFII